MKDLDVTCKFVLRLAVLWDLRPQIGRDLDYVKYIEYRPKISTSL